MSTISPAAASAAEAAGGSAARARRPAAQAEPPGPLPDLAIDRFEPDTYFPFPGDRVYFDVKVTNRGEADSPAFNVELSGSGIPRDTKVRIEGLKIGESAEMQMGPMEVWWRDFNFAEVRADSDKEIREKNERNNRRSVTLIGPEPPRPPEPPIPDPRPPRP